MSEVQFSESGGGSNVVGQSVGADGTRPFSSIGPGFHSGYSRDSRMMTIDNGRKMIASLAAQLALYSHHIDSAHRYFKLAVEHRFIQGRKTEYVVAACLYIVCRYEETPHMLLDFADALQVNVFTLGSVFLKLVQKLAVRKMPIIDPSLYMHRFAAKMKFGDKAHEVAKTALRLVARMKRDWIQVGRRPTGICGAALLVAARLHGFSKTQKEVINVVRVCDSTLRKRLEEFEATPSSNLTTQEFMKVDLEGEADPPAYTQARKKARLKEKANVASDSSSIQLVPPPPSDAFPVDVEEDVRRQAESEAFRALDVDTSATIAGSRVNTVRQKQQEAEKDLHAIREDDNLSDFTDDEDIDEHILNDEEIRFKQQIWAEENQEYLQKQKAKERQAEIDKELGIVKPPKKNKKKNKAQNKAPANASEAVQQMLQQKKTSSKINYDVLKELGMTDEGQELGAVPPEPPVIPDQNH